MPCFRSLALILLLVVALAACRQPAPYDLVIQGGQVIDGTGAPAYRADIGLRGDRIAFIGIAEDDLPARRRIDATGMVVAPGFIDPHTHIQRDLSDSARRANLAYLHQGVTTVIIGNDGGGPIEVGALLERLQRQGMGTHAGVLTGHNSLRRRAMGQADRPPTEAELADMKTWLARALDEGALGMSAGLFYSPGHFAETEEVIALAEVVARYDAVYDVHQRDESSYSIGLVEAVKETLRIARAAGVRTNISHIKALGADVWGKSEEVVQLVEAARREGLAVTADQYPYRASSTGLAAALLPRWVFADDPDYRPKLRDTTLLPRLRAEVAANIARRGGAESFLLTLPTDTTLRGQWLSDIAHRRGQPAEQAAIDILRRGNSRIASFNMQAEDIRHFMRQPWVMTGSDGVEGHPRKYGTYPRKLARYVREEKLLSLEAMVHRSSLLPARVFGLTERGRIAPGLQADLIVFDPAAVREQATFEAPARLATGMQYVLVDGQLAIERGRYTGVLAGRALRRQGAKAEVP